LKKYLKEIYGIEPEVLDEFEFLKKIDDVWVTTKKCLTPIPYQNAGLKINSIGFRAIRNSFEGNPKITTNFAQLLGKKIKKNIYRANAKEIEQYIKGYDLETKDTFISYCAIEFENKIIGVGLYKEGTIKNQIPKGRVLQNISIKE